MSSSSPLKRKFSTADITERDITKKPRVGSPTFTKTIEATACPGIDENVDSKQGDEDKAKMNVGMDYDEEVKRLKEELREVKERLTRSEQESNRKSEALSRICQSVQCAICRDTLENPYTLECGHSSCYKCLRRWWLTLSNNSSSLDDVETDDDSDNSNIPSRRLPSLRFQSVVHVQKRCPECRQVVSQWNRPAPDFRLRDVVDALHLEPLSSEKQMRRDGRWGRRKDVWKGIFLSSNAADADGSVMGSNRQTLHNQHAFYIPPRSTQGRIETPPGPNSSFPFHSRHPVPVEQHRVERRWQPYIAANPQRRERRRFERYDPVREAHSEMVERERQARARASSPSPSPILHLQHPESSSYEQTLGLTLRAPSPEQEYALAFAFLDRPLQPLEPEIEAVQTQTHPSVSRPPQSNPRSSFQSRSQTFPFYDIISSLPWSPLPRNT